VNDCINVIREFSQINVRLQLATAIATFLLVVVGIATVIATWLLGNKAR
jgi:hypothetical protein